MNIKYKCSKCDDTEMKLVDEDKHVCPDCEISHTIEEAEKLFKDGVLEGIVDEKTAKELIAEAKHNAKKMKEKEDSPEDENATDDEEEDKKDKKDKKDKNESLKIEIDVQEDVDALLKGEDLSEEFKAKVKTIFEAAVSKNVKLHAEKQDEKYESDLSEAIEENYKEIDAKVSEYMNYTAQEWLSENQLVVESSIKSELNDDFLEGLKSLFKEHYVEIPNGRYDVVEGLAKEVNELKEKLDETMLKNIELSKNVETKTKEQLVDEMSEGLADTEKEKFEKLVESVEFKDEESYVKEISTLKESYFKKSSNDVIKESQDTDESTDDKKPSYISALKY